MSKPGNRLSTAWIFWGQTVPLLCCLLLCWADYRTIQTLLSQFERQYWYGLLGLLAGLIVLSAAYLAWRRHRQAGVQGWYLITAGLLHVGFMFLVGEYNTFLRGQEVLNWLMTNNTQLYVYTWLLPMVMVTVYGAVVISIDPQKPPKAWPNLLWALAMLIVPLLIFLSLRFGSESRLETWLLIGAGILFTWGFSFFLIRWIYLLLQQKRLLSGELNRWLALVLTLVLPVLALLVNALFLEGTQSFWSSTKGVVGHFNRPLVYGLVLLNAVAICLPLPRRPAAALPVFLVLCATLPFTLYFVLVLLPWLPLALVASLFFGFGLLLLSPTFLLMLHLPRLRAYWARLSAHFSPRQLWLAAATSFLILPAFFTLSYWMDRQLIHKALVFAADTDLKAEPPGDLRYLKRLLEKVEGQGNRSSDFGMGGLPYLDRYWQWLALDNRSISQQRLQQMRQLYFAQAPQRSFANARPQPDSTIRLTGVEVETVYDPRQKLYRSWVHLELKNTEGWGNSLFTTTFFLPAGCFVNNYYLMMGKRKEFGLLAEKSAAEWVFRQILDVRQDPGLLRYAGPQTLQLSVFPFAANEARRTGICFVHREAQTLDFMGRRIELAAPQGNVDQPLRQPTHHYLTAAQKQALPLVQRKPVLHFLLDASAGTEPARLAKLIERMDGFVQSLPPDRQAHELHLVAMRGHVGAATKRLDAADAGRKGLFQGGYNLSRAMRQLLVPAALQPSQQYPVFVAVSDRFDKAVLPWQMGSLATAVPETNGFYELTPQGQLLGHPFLDPLGPSADSVWRPALVHRYAFQGGERYLAASPGPALVTLSGPAEQQPAEPPDSSRLFEKALALQALQAQHDLGLLTAQQLRAQALPLSFATGLLHPSTSYLALENEGQKIGLRKKQEEVLQGHALLEDADDFTPMPEPEEWALLLMALGLVGWHQWRRRQLAA